MSLPIFLDTNIPIYAAGQPHALRDPCREIIRLVVAHPAAFFANSEVLQELLHRYRAVHRWSQGKGVFERFAALMRDRIEPIYAEDVESAASLADRLPGLSSRDLIHLTVMARVGADQIVSADRGFDRVPGVTRLDPAHLSAWRAEVEA